MRILLAPIAAILVQPVILVLRFLPDYLLAPSPQSFPSGIGSSLLFVLIFATAAVMCLGIPTFILLRKLNRDGWLSLGISGFLLSAVPVAFLWPQKIDGYSSGSNWHGKFVNSYIDGLPTNYAWFIYFENVFFYGLHGLIGALVFYAVWRRVDKRNKPIEK
jgi:hypothetical protein